MLLFHSYITYTAHKLQIICLVVFESVSCSAGGTLYAVNVCIHALVSETAIIT